jgi:adenylate cyclase
MKTEIERKFKVRMDVRNLNMLILTNNITKAHIRQGYIFNGGKDGSSVRIRTIMKHELPSLKNTEKGLITIKKNIEGSFSRMEYEYEIPFEDAEVLLKESCPSVLEKIRVKIPVGNHVWDFDVFMGKHEGLMLAEIELKSEEEEFEMPDWNMIEVTDDPQYLNSNLAKE